MSLVHKSLTLKNYQLGPLVQFLGIPLPAQQARPRNRFILLFAKPMQAVEDRRLELLKEFGDLDEKGNLQMEDGAGTYKLKDRDGFHKEYDALMKAEYPVPCVGNALLDFKACFEILKTLGTLLTVEQTTIYDEVMTAFEEWAGEESAPAEAAA